MKDTTPHSRLQELAEQAYNQAQVQGFWTPEPHPHTLLMLVISHVSDAVKSHNSGNIGSSFKFWEKEKTLLQSAGNDNARKLSFLSAYNEHLQGTFAEDLAKAIIACLDLLAWARQHRLSNQLFTWEEIEEWTEHHAQLNQKPANVTMASWLLAPIQELAYHQREQEVTSYSLKELEVTLSRVLGYFAATLQGQMPLYLVKLQLEYQALNQEAATVLKDQE